MKQLLRTAASLLATLLGGVLLIADGGECGQYDAFKGSARYTADCGALASGEGAFTLDLPATDSSADGAMWKTARRQLAEGGLQVSRLYFGYSGTCTDDDGHLAVSSLHLVFKDAKFREYLCEGLDLPVVTERTVSCVPPNDGWETISCTITFRPPPP